MPCSGSSGATGTAMVASSDSCGRASTLGGIPMFPIQLAISAVAVFIQPVGFTGVRIGAAPPDTCPSVISAHALLAQLGGDSARFSELGLSVRHTPESPAVIGQAVFGDGLRTSVYWLHGAAGGLGPIRSIAVVAESILPLRGWNCSAALTWSSRAFAALSASPATIHRVVQDLVRALSPVGATDSGSPPTVAIRSMNDSTQMVRVVWERGHQRAEAVWEVTWSVSRGMTVTEQSFTGAGGPLGRIAVVGFP